MKRLLVSLLFVLLPSTVLSAELVIGKDETYTVTEDQVSLSLERLVIGDNARIQFAEGVSHWELLARDATIGHGVVIDGRGNPGSEGSPGEEHADRAASCRSGKGGNSGEPGATGSRGVDIYLGLDARRIGSLQIIADGGDGGPGGKGGRGQQGGGILNCSPPSGGTGGAGGVGGQGGDGGNVVVSVSSFDGERDVSVLTAGVRVSTRPGKGGPGGAGGEGGEGADGQFVSGKTLTGTRRWVGGGRAGRAGVPGDPGDGGRFGQVFIGGQFTGFDPSLIQEGGFEGFSGIRPAQQAQPSQEAEQEIRLLREQLRALQERMEKLESQ